MIEAASVWCLDEHVRFRRLFDEAVVIHQQRSEALVLNETGATFLELCDGRSTLSTILSKMAGIYGVSEKTLLDDLTPFIDELARDGLIHQGVGESV
jgi:hypothetical protein